MEKRKDREEYWRRVEAAAVAIAAASAGRESMGIWPASAAVDEAEALIAELDRRRAEAEASGG